MYNHDLTAHKIQMYINVHVYEEIHVHVHVLVNAIGN